MDVAVYPISKCRLDRMERASAVRCTSDLRQKINDRTAAQKFRRLLVANFLPSDFVVTLTYSGEALPATPEQARDRCLKPFIRKLRADLRKVGTELKYMYVTEGLHGDKRLHHHIILPYTQFLKEIVGKHWKLGYIGYERISSRGYDLWGSYLTKEPRKTGRRRVGDRMWTPSLNLIKPTVTTYEVEDDFRFEPPAGVVVRHNEDWQTEWFCCQYLSYYKPEYIMES